MQNFWCNLYKLPCCNNIKVERTSGDTWVLLILFAAIVVFYLQKQPPEVFYIKRCCSYFFQEYENISQKSQKNTCARVSFLIKLQASCRNHSFLPNGNPSLVVLCVWLLLCFIKKKAGYSYQILHIVMSFEHWKNLKS